MLVTTLIHVRAWSLPSILELELWPRVPERLLPGLTSYVCPHFISSHSSPWKLAGFVKSPPKPTGCQLSQNWLQGYKVFKSYMTPTQFSLWKLWLSHAVEEKKSSLNQYLPLAGMCTGTDWGKNKSFEHNMQQCVQICFMAELEIFLIVNMSRSFVPPTQKCVLWGVGFYSWPS